jgi:hypothetical protein
LTDTLAATKLKLPDADGFDAAILASPAFGVSYHDWMMRRVFDWPDMFHLFVTGSCWILRALETDAGRRAMYSAEIEKQKHKAISRLRKRLMQPTAAADDATIIGIIHLSRLAAEDGNWKAVQIHRKQLRWMLQTTPRLVDDGAHFVVMDLSVWLQNLCTD